MLDPNGYATAYPNCNLLNADTDGNGTVNSADAAAFAGMLVAN